MSIALNLPAETNKIKQQRFILLASIVALLIVYLLGAYSGILEGKHVSWWNDLFWTLGALAAGWRCLITAKNRSLEHERKAWLFFGLAALSWFMGMLVWDYYEIFKDSLVPTHSLGNWFFMGYTGLFIIGLIYYRSDMPTRQYNIIQISNLGLLICTIVILCFIFLSRALEQSDHSTAYKFYALSHAIFPILNFVFGIYCYWFYIWRKNLNKFRLMLLALFVHAVTDTLYSFSLLGQDFDAASYLNVYWLIALALQYWAAFEQDTVREIPSEVIEDRGMPRARKYEAIMPSLCILTILAFSVYFMDWLNETTFKVMAYSTVAFAFFLTMREWHTNSLEISLLKSVEVANKRLDDQVQIRTAELSNVIQELDAFSYSVSHDLRAPLRGIDGFSQALLEDYSDAIDDTGKDYLKRVRIGTQKMSTLIDAMLKLSHVSREAIHKKALALDEIVNDVIKQLRGQEPQRQVDITIKENVTAKGDEHLIRIVLENLVGNAWKYTGNMEQAQIEFGVIEQNDETIYYIKDNGAGFDMSYANKLFDAFHRLHGAEFDGAGIGLATVQRCLRRHGGRIWAEAEVDAGATFYFTLP